MEIFSLRSSQSLLFKNNPNNNAKSSKTADITIEPKPPIAQASFQIEDSDNQQAAPASKVKKLTRAELDALLAKPDRVLVIDVRRPDEVTSIGGFPAYLSIQAADIEKSLAWIPKGRTIVTVSNHTTRSGRVADVLTAHGFTVAGAIYLGRRKIEPGAGVTRKPLMTM